MLNTLIGYGLLIIAICIAVFVISLQTKSMVRHIKQCRDSLREIKESK